MSTYKVWVGGRRQETEELVKAATSFDARAEHARKHKVQTYEVVDVRQDD